METDTPRKFEELTMNAWPALQTLYYDGWVLRFANGYTRRANSVATLYPGDFQPAEKIGYCEQLYGLYGRTPIFKLTPASLPDLDTMLDDRGYQRDAASLVMFLPDVASVPVPEYPDIQIYAALNPSWTADYIALSGTNPDHVPTMTQMLANVRFPQAFVTLCHEGAPIAVGMATVERGYVCYNDIVVSAAQRGKGIGTQLMRHLTHWAATNGAVHGYLQVLADNVPALKLYTGMGFREMYPYWYRVNRGTTWSKS